MASLAKFSPGFFLSKANEHKAALRMRDALAIRVATRWQAVGNLSGGNQQKVALAKWLVSGVSTLIIVEPTRGVDVGCKARNLRAYPSRSLEQGGSVILITSEIDEALMCDRVLILSRGRTTASVSRSESNNAGKPRSSTSIQLTIPKPAQTMEFKPVAPIPPHSPPARRLTSRPAVRPQCRSGHSSARSAPRDICWLVGAIVLLVGSALSQHFMTSRNLISVLITASVVSVLAVGQYLVIVTGGIDLSVGAVAAVSSVIAGLALQQGTPWPVALLLALLTAGLIGHLQRPDDRLRRDHPVHRDTGNDEHCPRRGLHAADGAAGGHRGPGLPRGLHRQYRPDARAGR